MEAKSILLDNNQTC